MGFSSPRLVLNNVLLPSQQEGEGIVVRNCSGSVYGLDPFLMLYDVSVTPPCGFSDHPHRAHGIDRVSSILILSSFFETVTYVIQGAFAIEDFTDYKSIIRAGDVQWMTVGRGLIHSEMAGGEGTNIAVQLWINLSSEKKMIEPRCVDVLSQNIPTVEQDGVKVRILAGEALGVHSPVYSQTPIMFLDFTLMPEAQLHQRIPVSWNFFIYVIEGEGTFGSSSSPPMKAHNLLVLGHGDGLSVWNNTLRPLRFLLMGGEPLNESVVQHGPFVMTTQSEIEKTIQDFRQLKNGFEPGRHWRS